MSRIIIRENDADAREERTLTAKSGVGQPPFVAQNTDNIVVKMAEASAVVLDSASVGSDIRLYVSIMHAAKRRAIELTVARCVQTPTSHPQHLGTSGQNKASDQ